MARLFINHFICFLIVFFFSPGLLAQNNGQTIQRVASGSYSFAKGEISLSLSDTVSKNFAVQQIENKGYEILTAQISPIRFLLRKHVEDSLLKEISTHPFVSNLKIRPGRYDSVGVEEMIIRQKMDSVEAERSRKSFRSMMERPTIWIIMKWDVLEPQANSFKELFPDLNLQLPMNIPRSITVKTEIGEEQEAMKDLKKLSIVIDAAYIALVDQ